MSDSHKRILQVVNAIPPGRVATYGQVAQLAGLPRRARLVGTVLANLDESEQVPWHRVINARGAISERSSLGGSEDYQRILLEAEGIVFDERDTIELSRYRWKPDNQ
ncbi:MAG: MGMT family protein [Thiotrichales bacterium]|nr:MGMT family protein [Thiotrichales bacterium]